MLRSEWAKYISVVTSGYLEEGIRVVLYEYIRTRADPSVARFSRGKLREFQNPSPDNIEKVLASFDASWVEKLAGYWRDERRDAVASVVNNRHNAAHGRHFGTSLGTIIKYYRSADEVVAFLHDLLLYGRTT
jgi:hypothetical protein